MEIRPIFSALLRSKTGAVLIALQVALTLAILSNASYVVQDRLAVAARPTGTDEENVFFTRWYAFREGVDIPAMLDRDLALIRAIPGVRSVATANMAPLTQSGWNLSVSRHQDAEREETFNTAFYFTSESLIDALGLELVQGRDFRPDEVQIVEPSIANIEPKSAILTRALAEQLFPDESEYVGKTAFLGDSQFEVVGIVERLQSPWAQLERRGEVSMIVPMRQLVASAAFMVRSEPGQQARVQSDVEAALGKAMDGRVHLGTTTLTEARANRYRTHHAMAWLLLSVMGLLLLVTASGIVGMASLWVNQRRKQIGIRRAIGARQGDILRYFLVENFLVTTAGVATGTGMALALNQWLIHAIDAARLPLSHVLFGALLLWVLGLGAAFGPAWRAARIAPAVATRSV
ncbi:MAG: ABC transporter permease [Xanthomonadales bacterium]|nr:ABC transporter permease [Xanthomonadales bacterium]